MAVLQRQFNWHNFWICFFISMGNVAFGYPAAIIGTTLSQPDFLVYMGLVSQDGLSANAHALIGAMNGVFQSGALFGIFTAEMVMEKWGRKMGVFYTAALSIIGGIFVTASQNVAMFIAFRFVAGAGSGLIQVCPVYSSELAPPSLRGFFVGMNGMLIAAGYAFAAYMGLAFNSIHDSPQAQWRGPLGMSLVFSSFMIVILPFIPESPRWLLMKDHADKAWDIVRDLHHSRDDKDHDFARREFYQIRKQIELDRTLENSWYHMLLKPSYRKRSLLAIGYAFLGESTAVLVITNYASVLYGQLGYNSHQQICLQAGYHTVPIIGNLIGALIMDKVGRRPLMLLGLGGCAIFLSIEAAMVASFVGPGKAHNDAGLNMGVAALYCFIFCYAIGIDVAGIVFFGEMFPNHIRSKGFSLSVGTKAITDLVYLEAASTAFANIGWKFFLLFISIVSVGFVVMWIYIPETKGLPLEEVAAVFGDKDEVMLYLRDIQVDQDSDKLQVHRFENDKELTRIVTEATENQSMRAREA
ncbi:uncharacterized protein Z518_07402 [Rhinocladiella mackenziei CBS 650.93]|uniref:Major facilitator superfamily (MFS) profile domain-containing protein n=1 Tax=Rhinocladiella mackenziei CBS 650.93 TaxID=1442369 RepID=A0A0D2IDE2_9EURO|nr:uncharacterized protein Z518_07402 [Rhinocladiella mackenziei CBS 650.93]KIX03849.1 hypothetical protein Z518_07402 [Rhinocladiella mackenziei CBS 650.93]